MDIETFRKQNIYIAITVAQAEIFNRNGFASRIFLIETVSQVENMGISTIPSHLKNGGSNTYSQLGFKYLSPKLGVNFK